MKFYLLKYSWQRFSHKVYSCARPIAVGFTVFFSAILFSTNSVAQLEPDKNTDFAVGGADTCLVCHRQGGLMPAEAILRSPHGISANPESPFAAKNNHCQTCHGPSADHLRLNKDNQRPSPSLVFDKHFTAEEKNRVCLGCHQDEVGQDWHGSAHQFQQIACHDCHRVHIGQDPILAANSQAPVCFSCHSQQRSELQRPSAHPVGRGLLGCGDCHQPHGGRGEFMLVKNTLNETCYDCHAEKRGPMLWEHAPVREDCSNCHLPHGSNHANLLVSRPPFLCQQCHLSQFHPSTAFGGGDIPPNGTSRYLLNRSCINCHTQIHGSNHPSGSRLTR